MVATGEGPDVAVEARQEADLHSVAAALDEVSDGGHEVGRFERFRKLGAERIAGTRREDDESSLGFDVVRAHAEMAVYAFDAGDTFAVNFGAAGSGTVKQHAVEYAAREDGDGLSERERGAATRGTDELAGGDHVMFDCRIAKEWILREGFLRDAAATGLFPRELLVKNNYLTSVTGENVGNQSTCGSATNNSDQGRGIHKNCIL